VSRPPAKHRLGQHFLFDPSILRRIADATLAGPDDTVLEIGPGPGGLTARLLERGARVVAIERDPDQVEELERRAPSAQVVLGDALELDWHEVAGAPAPARWIIAGNIPYNITSPLLDKALDAPVPARIVFLVQREVADRLAAEPGSRSYGALTVGVQSAARVERLFRIPRGAFTPPPKVESALVRLTPLSAPLVPPASRATFRRFVVALFGLRRKQLQGALRQVTSRDAEEIRGALHAANARPEQRAETLSPQQLWCLAEALVDGAEGAC
jgi:16S rRNA (adenine1518-N6/adenine1519-N6)-dimethyltransferase